ncbi:putative holin-like toxin [Butyricicoccus sp.]
MYVTFSDLFQCLSTLFSFGTMLIALIAFLGKRK